MFKKAFAITLVVISVAGLYFKWSSRAIHHPPGILAPDKPYQKKLEKGKAFQHGEYQISPLADFQITARVLCRENYYLDRESDISPVDFALGWGRMSDEAVLANFSIWQSRRFYFWKTDRLPIPRREIEKSSANMHLIPADDDIADLLADVRVGHVVSLKGNLVQVKHPGGWKWRSSLSRGDTGAGACELFWVTEVEIADGR